MTLHLLERLSWPTMHKRCKLICDELGQFNCGNLKVNHNGLVIKKFPWSGKIMIFVKCHMVYDNGWADGIKRECKQKIKQVINDQFIKALNSRHIRIQQQCEQDRRKIEELNTICGEWNGNQ